MNHCDAKEIVLPVLCGGATFQPDLLQQRSMALPRHMKNVPPEKGKVAITSITGSTCGREFRAQTGFTSHLRTHRPRSTNKD